MFFFVIVALCLFAAAVLTVLHAAGFVMTFSAELFGAAAFAIIACGLLVAGYVDRLPIKPRKRRPF